jgi:hypothetical protein
MRRFLQWLQPAGAYAWRWLGGMPAGDAPRADAGWPARADVGQPAPGHEAPPPGTAPPLPGKIVAEIRWDLRELSAELHDLLVRRALGREFRDVERQILAEHDPSGNQDRD